MPADQSPADTDADSDTLLDLVGRRCVITGASDGIGREIARGLAWRGADVALVGRTPAKLDAATASVARDARGGRVTSHVADFDSLAAARTLAEALLDESERVDVLCNNAGTSWAKRWLTVDGVEATFAVNHLAPYVLTHALLPALRDTAATHGEARVVHTASAAHFYGRSDGDWQLAKRWQSQRAYGTSKLCNILFSDALAERLVGTGVTSNAYHPGIVRTKLFRQNRLLDLLYKVAPVMRTPAQGADTALWLATDPSMRDVTGGYFSDRSPGGRSSAAKSERLREELWAESVRLTGVGA